ncbi:MAG TPA: YchJ family metal-binding protein [Methylophilaceae bacterium]
MVEAKSSQCHCGKPKSYQLCCEPLHLGQSPASAEALMRSRYSAYKLGLQDYLLNTWHVSTRPQALDLSEPVNWLGLKVIGHSETDPLHAQVEFVARYKLHGRAYRLHELSQFVCEQGRWFYIDGLAT